MSRCKNTRNLEVHHKRRDGGNDINNAEVLCQECHAHTSTYGKPGITPPRFTQKVKDEAMKIAGYRCQCTRKDCHD